MKHSFRPPMGWNSWDAYGASVTQEEVLANAKAMAQTLAPYGWEYVVVDIQWYEPLANSTVYHPFTPLVMDDYSRLRPASNRFPWSQEDQGFQALGQAIHDLGLKFGIHIMRGIPRQAVHQNTPLLGSKLRARDIALNNICPWNSDMYGVNVDLEAGQAYYDSLIALYASWGVDFLKVDDIAYSRLYGSSHQKEIQAIAKAIEKCGRPMVLSLSPGPAQVAEGAFLQEHATMWRVTDDLWDHWTALKHMFTKAKEWVAYIQPGSYPDFDMLPLGHIGVRAVDGGGGDAWTRLTPDEQVTMMSLWTMMQSPLILGGLVTDLDPFTLSLLTNQEILTMYHQVEDRSLLYDQDDWVLWLGCGGGQSYLALFNLADQDRTLGHDLLRVLPFKQGLDLWQAQTCVLESNLSLPAHGALVVKK